MSSSFRKFHRAACAALALAMLAGPAFADCGAIDMPPSQFDHVPAATVHVEFRPYYKVDQACRTVLTVPVSGREEACAGFHVGVWWVFLPLTDRYVTSEAQECLLRHEFGHLNGWLPTHPDARFE